MLARDLDSLSALGRSLTHARDNGVISTEQFGLTARALATAMMTGTIEMDAYAGIHWVLGQMIEAAFSSKSRGDDLDAYVETVGRMWNYVGPSSEALQGVDRFLNLAFDMEKARFEREVRFWAPLKLAPAEIARLLKAAGVAVISSGGAKIEKPTSALLTDIAGDEMHLILGWGERRMALVFRE